MATINRTFNSFSGADITAVFSGQAIGTIQALSYSIQREKAAVYTMGSANPRAFSRGKRMIAGSLIFILFDANPVISHFVNADGSGAKFLGDAEELSFEKNFGTDKQVIDPVVGDDSFESHALASPTYVDQIPPFDVVISAVNEYGARASMTLFGVELMNENSGFSIDDIVVEQQYTFIATGITAWAPGTKIADVKAR
jgi:hypothetical protein